MRATLDMLPATPGEALAVALEVPGWLVDVADAIFGAEDDIDEALEDIELKHTYTPTLTEGQAQINGVP